MFRKFDPRGPLQTGFPNVTSLAFLSYRFLPGTQRPFSFSPLVYPGAVPLEAEGLCSGLYTCEDPVPENLPSFSPFRSSFELAAAEQTPPPQNQKPGFLVWPSRSTDLIDGIEFGNVPSPPLRVSNKVRGSTVIPARSHI